VEIVLYIFFYNTILNEGNHILTVTIEEMLLKNENRLQTKSLKKSLPVQLQS